MDDEWKVGLVLLVVLTVAVLLTVGITILSVHQNAAEAGAARYVMEDDTVGTVRFQWIDSRSKIEKRVEKGRPR